MKEEREVGKGNEVKEGRKRGVQDEGRGGRTE